MMTIGELAGATGVPTSTLRFWERRGLLDPPARSGGQRRYGEQALAEVAMLKLGQDAGLTLAEIERVGEALGRRDQQAWRDFVRVKLAEIDERRQRLDHAHRILAHALECPAPSLFDCARFQEAITRRGGVQRSG